MKGSKTTWDKIISGEQLIKIKNLRSKKYIEKKERKSALPELEQEGWSLYKEYANKKDVKVRREKKVDEVFEDRVWMVLANMGFSDMNEDRNFIMSYDFKNPNFTQQIDVFAADEETVLFVECKAAEFSTDGKFKKQIEALHGQMDGLRKEVQSRYPKHKVKFIWATHNYRMGKADLEKLKEWGIVYFNDASIDYYTELSDHLGSSAKYQLLGNLFEGQEIRNMEDRIPAIQGKMGGFKYYSFSIEPERLLKISYVAHRNEANGSMMPTYQRLIKKNRLKDIKNFVSEGGYFPNSLIISIDSKKKGLQFDESSMKVDGSISKIGILHLPKRYRSAYIIDGQHRLYGYSDSKYAFTNSIPVVAFEDLDKNEQLKLFMEINENQKAVSKTLRVTLNADMMWDSKDYNEQRQALRSKVSQMIGENSTSPLFDRVKIGENEGTSEKCITVDAIQTALSKCSFLTHFKNNKIELDGTFDLADLDATCNLLYPFLEKCLEYVKEHCEEEWSKGDKYTGVLTINRGIQGLIRVINDIVNLLIENKTINPKSMKPDQIFDEVKCYLNPLIEYLNSITLEQRKDLRSSIGSGGDTRFWRTFQRVIAEKYDNFHPEGLDKYWLEQEKTFNEESTLYIKEITKILKNIIKNKLYKDKGEDWLYYGIPHQIYTRANNEVNEQEYNNKINGESDIHFSVWDCVKLRDCKDIILYERNWSTLFNKYLTRPQDVKMQGGKEKKTEWISKLSKINNKLSKSSGITSEDAKFVKDVYEWITNLQVEE